jgi:hypothetical protein
MANNLETLHQILKKWYGRFPNVECISVFMTGDKIRLRVDWKNNFQFVWCTKEFSLEEMNFAYYMDEEKILQEIEDAYMRWEVGEE